MIVAGFFESKKNHGNELIEKLEAGMQDMLQIVEDRKRDVVAPKMKENLQYVGGTWSRASSMKSLKMYMNAKIKDNPNLEDCVFHIVVDCYNAPGSRQSCGRIYRSNHREKTPFYGSALKYWVCTMAMAREVRGFENDSESSQVFWLLKERELTPSNSNILDGRYDVFGGYVTQNEDFLADLKVDDVTEVIQVVSDIILRDPTTFETFFLIIMASTSTILAALKYGRCSSTVEVEVRLLRFWEARNIKRGGHFMGVNMLLLDSKAMLIPATINVNRLPTYRGHLKGTVIRAANPAQTSSSEDSSQELSSPEDSTESKIYQKIILIEKAESAAKALAVADSKVFEAKEASQVADTAPKKSLTDVLKDENVELWWMLHVGRGAR
ncbi:hypothetical protein HID58_044442 [Brassica napus]|uniref:peptidylprolyl isomerase n=1 Tax=Brassica napus TaxID=3708 RepID=A0ABQ8BJC7_BRANA|nr:hypothetical protein HID58_044442 [Brassica napus]